VNEAPDNPARLDWRITALASIAVGVVMLVIALVIALS
jgi:hypothetical protein